MDNIKFADYGQERELNVTAGEIEIFNLIKKILEADGADTSRIKLVRKSKNYVTVIVSFEDPCQLDLARIKYTNLSQWIWTSFDGKVQIDSVEDTNNLSEAFINDYRQHIDWMEESYPELL